jgi:uncharacterized membrane protein YhaH (DUF805 family)
MKNSFLSSEGGIGRISFILRLVLLAAIAAGISYGAIYYFAHYFHHGTFGTLGIFFSIVASLLCMMAGLMQLLKRLRDMGKGAYFSLLMLIPGVNVLFLLYACVAPSKAV